MKESLNSVGIDIGTTTTQLVFSLIEVDNRAGLSSVPRFGITKREVVYRSDIYETPLISKNLINGEALRDIVAKEYCLAGYQPQDIKAGAVIITGETARKENAEILLHSLSDYVGDFVVASAGSDLEAAIAGKGAGTAELSKRMKKTISNFDVGGGTTNVAIFKDGELIDTTCLDIGGRLIKIDSGSMMVEYVAPKISALIQHMGVDVKEGHETDLLSLRRIVRRMAAFLDEISGFVPRSEELPYVITSKELKNDHKIDCVTFSGGVADAVYDPDINESELFKYNDIGVILGQSIRNGVLFNNAEVLTPRETIRATVIGAGSYSLNVSGSTINYTKDVFPLKNVPVAKINYYQEGIRSEDISERISRKTRMYMDESGYQQIAIYISGISSPNFDEVKKIANEVIKGLAEAIEYWDTVIVISDEDMGKALGFCLKSILEKDINIISLDGIYAEDGDYIDIGRPIGQGRVIPVVIKTLVFGA